MRVTLKVMPPILVCCPTTSEVDVGGMIVELSGHLVKYHWFEFCYAIKWYFIAENLLYPMVLLSFLYML